MKRYLRFVFVILAMSTLFTACGNRNGPHVPDTAADFYDMIVSATDIDALLERPYVTGLPLGYCDEVFSLYQPGWGFDEPAIHCAGEEKGFGMKVSVSEDGTAIPAGESVHRPSHVTVSRSDRQTVNLIRPGETATEVSFAQTSYGCNHKMAFDGVKDDPGKTWNTWCPEPRNQGEWVIISFPDDVEASGISLYLYTDQNCFAPASVRGEYSSDGENWKAIGGMKLAQSVSGTLDEYEFDAVRAKEFRFTFTPAADKALSFREIELNGMSEVTAACVYTGYKYISTDGAAVAIVEAENKTDKTVNLEVAATPLYDCSPCDGGLCGSYSWLSLFTVGNEGFEAGNGVLKCAKTLDAGEKHAFTVVTSFARNAEESVNIARTILGQQSPVEYQKDRFLGWFAENVPFIDVPDEKIKQIYYYRWYTYRSNIRLTAEGNYVITEFLPNVGWSGAYNTINMAMADHISEGRWLKNKEYVTDYADFWLTGKGKSTARSFTSTLSSACLDYYLATGDGDFIARILPDLKKDYAAWEREHFDGKKGLFVSNNGVDGMEYSAVSPSEWGTEGYRPTANSYRYADLKALAFFCALTGDSEGERTYLEKAEKLKTAIEKTLWDEQDGFYKWEVKKTGELSGPRELIGYIPWTWGIAPDDAEHAAAWDLLDDPDYFLAAFGLRTVEKKYSRTVPDGEFGSGTCRWDGPVWPFATTQTLDAMIGYMRSYSAGQDITGKFISAVSTYAYSQYKDGYPWIAEDLDGESGKWIADIDRSVNYNHSKFADTVIRGIFGITPGQDGTLRICPAIPEEWDHFCIEGLNICGNSVSVIFDRDGTVYGKGAGLFVVVNGAASSFGSVGELSGKEFITEKVK